MSQYTKVEDRVIAWLSDVVIGLNLCPFAHKPFKDDRVRVVVEEGDSYDSILERMLAELRLLDSDKDKKVETTLVVVPNALESFQEYLACLSDINSLVLREGYEGEYQVASFHPDYQFDGTEQQDVSNYTNRSPYPIFHLIREESLERVLQGVQYPEEIPERNIQLMESLEKERLITLFPWMFPNKQS